MHDGCALRPRGVTDLADSAEHAPQQAPTAGQTWADLSRRATPVRNSVCVWFASGPGILPTKMADERAEGAQQPVAQPTDCLGCKLVASTTLLGGGAYVLYYSRRQHTQTANLALGVVGLCTHARRLAGAITRSPLSMCIWQLCWRSAPTGFPGDSRRTHKASNRTCCRF